MKRTMRCPVRQTLVPILLLLPVLAGCAGHRAQVRGKPPAGSATPVARLATAPSSGTVTVHGAMVEKCPAAGCWFVLQDDTGQVRVDLKAAGFVVTDVPTGGDVTVTGRLRRGESEPVIVASGVRFE